ncbi:MAG: hypothetical protein LKK49_04660 [Leuconostoc mesenteroides]|jgi:hypothetical protein|nr:hypothetical protein [Leuconostoc mesenteroides]MCI2167343.1 hypothetical protein [Leuconostoc mesenteroides]
MNSIEDMITTIKTLFTKQPNTIYEVRIVDQRYAKKVNIFFEYYKIGKARRSQQIGRLDDEYRLQIPALVKQIHEATGLTIRTSD